MKLLQLVPTIHEYAEFAAFAADDSAEDIVVMSSSEEEYVDYSNMYNWAYWNKGEEKAADLFFVCPTVDMGKDGNFISDITNEKYYKLIKSLKIS